MLYLYKHSESHRNIAKTPSVGNHYHLVECDSDEAMQEFARDTEADYAEGSFEGEGEDEFWDHVERNGGSSNWCRYDRSNPIHIQHNGFEDQRPEAVEYQRIKAAEDKANHQKAIRATIAKKQAQMLTLNKEILELQKELTNDQ